jgi:hypothetical protein
MSYTIGVNRIGVDVNNHEYNGQSQIIDALGQTILAAANVKRCFMTTLHKTQVETRGRFRFLNDRDFFLSKVKRGFRLTLLVVGVKIIDIKVFFPIKIGMNVYLFRYITSSGSAL